MSSGVSDSVIQVRGLRKTYHMGKVAVEALRGVDLDVPRRRFSIHRGTLRVR